MTNQPHPEVFRGLALAAECTTGTQLVGHGLAMVTASSWLPSEPAAAFTCLSSGVERLLKLTFGLSIEAAGDPFPSDKDLRKLGHNLRDLDVLVAQRVSSGSVNRYVAKLLAEVAADPYWPYLLGALDSWADSAGRYRDLTVLTGAPAVGDPAWAEWEVAEHQVVSDLGLWAEIGGPGAKEVIAQVRDRLAVSIMRWWHTIYRCWQHGLLGPKGTQASSALAPEGCTHLPSHLLGLVRGR